jgi:hypothetical protein
MLLSGPVMQQSIRLVAGDVSDLERMGASGIGRRPDFLRANGCDLSVQYAGSG